MARIRARRELASGGRCCVRTEIRETASRPARYAVRLVDLETGEPVTPRRVFDSLAEARREATTLIARVARI